MNISLIDLKAQYRSLSGELNNAVSNVLSSANYIMGKNVIEFEKEFSNYLGVKHSISVGNGTDALIIALKSLGIGKGDEVITSPFTFFATAESISSVSATPVFVDIEKDTFNIDVSKIEEKITSKTKAILPVHIFGQPVDMDEILFIAKKHNLCVIEDACQAIGSEYKGKKIGTFGDVACFSFYPTKNLGCAGDGGMIVTNKDHIAIIAKALRVHGSGENGQKAYNLLENIHEEVIEDKNTSETLYNPLKYYNYLIGFNSRLDAMQAAILSVKLKYIDKWNTIRRYNVKYYNENIENKNIVKPFEKQNRKHVYHMYIIQSKERDRMINYLNKKGIATGIYYSVPLHLQKAYKGLCYKKGDMPNAEYISHRTFAIPMYAELTDKQREYIVEAVNNFK
ncbi:DegT/DnrJ/EryC1/StrS family aminotransferase [Clostridium sp.]|jgi:dTDP-4-amino-4,6-dideoxygalactose transaminase|uniref:DegT/DnrJ/EryC1/StrS family aminotransferase n=1 Tax=Clostridium sp. TaxID=1506 RepID=UPI00258345AE|nr:DegT/DnrJ/EryC1/StrS family aminotransferase [Clostridium sp.]MDF2504124.1 degT2 [Clostridium sp.]